MANRGRRAARPKTGGCKSLGMTNINSRAYVRSAKGKSTQCLVTKKSKSGKKVIVRDSNGLAKHKKSCTLANKKLVKVKKVTFCSTRKMKTPAQRKAAAAKRRAATPRKRKASATVCISKATGNETIPKLNGACKKGSTKKKSATKSSASAKNTRCQKNGKFVGKLKSGKCPKGAKTISVKKKSGTAKRRKASSKASANFVCQSERTKRFTRRTANGKCRAGSNKITI